MFVITYKYKIHSGNRKIIYLDKVDAYKKYNKLLINDKYCNVSIIETKDSE